MARFAILAGLLIAAPVYLTAAADCAVCHRAIAEAYAKTGMGRSISRKPAAPDASFFHRRSNRHYQVAGGTVRRHQVDAQKREVNVVEKSVDFAIGSGNHAVTLVHRSPEGRLLQLPLSFYKEGGWQMSPGYDRPDHSDFRREIGEACLFCHSGGPAPSPIGCSRCHGDGAAHAAKPSRANIVNPKRLSPDRALDVCLQCHLETTSRGFPDSLRKPDRAVFSFQPGESLSDYKAHFDRGDGKERFEVNHAGYRMLQSRCFTGSKGALTCTTCHDPHTARARANACASCHNQTEHVRAAADCAGCHMPVRRTEDALHVRMTDHRIARKPEFTEPRGEDHSPYEAGLVAFFRPVEPPRLLELARLRHKADLNRATEPDFRRWLALEPDSPVPMTALAVRLILAGKPAEAAKLLEQALKIEPANLSALNALAIHHASAGRFDEALALLARARAANPDHPLTWINAGVTHEALGDRREAEAAYREAIRHQPDSSEARRRLAALLQQ